VGLDAFLAKGDPPLVFTLGSLTVYADDGFFAAGAEAWRMIGQRAILLVGDELLSQHRALAGQGVFVAGYLARTN